MRSDALYYKILGDYFARIMNAHEEGKLIGLHTVFLPPELLYALDIVPVHAETTTWMTAIFTRSGPELLAKASEMGLATEICSAHRGLAASYAIGALPRADFVLWSSLMCDNTAKSGELLMELNQCPGFFVDHPFQGSGREVEYLAGEFGDLVGFLERQAGRKMDWDRLGEIVSRANQQIELCREINELRKNRPSPFPPARFLELLTTFYLLPGQPEALEYLQVLRDDLVERVRQGRGAVAQERFRTMSLFVPPMHAIGFLANVAEELGAVSVVEPFFDLWAAGSLDPSRSLEALAKKSYMFPEMSMYGPLDERTLGAAERSAREYHVDGAIFYAHIGCRAACATVKPIRDRLAEMDIPMLTLDMDILDPTVASEADMRLKMEQFFEMLQERKE